MTACPDAFEALCTLWTGERTQAERDAIEEHIFTCDECAAKAERLASLLGGLQELAKQRPK